MDGKRRTDKICILPSDNRIAVALLVFGCVVIVHCLLSVSGVSYVGLISQLMLVPRPASPETVVDTLHSPTG